MDNLCEWQKKFVLKIFNEGKRTNNLGDQPAPWVLEGLRILERGEELTAEKINEINLAGGTDHPDPTISI